MNNKRRNRDYNRIQKSMTNERTRSFDDSFDFVIKFKILYSFLHVSTFKISNENILFRIWFSRQQISTSICLIENIIDEKIFHNVKFNIIQRVFLKKWQQTLKKNMNLIDDISIYCDDDDVRLQKITSNRHFKTTLFVAQN